VALPDDMVTIPDEIDRALLTRNHVGACELSGLHAVVYGPTPRGTWLAQAFERVVFAGSSACVARSSVVEMAPAELEACIDRGQAARRGGAS
jgi:hypothetical protein